MLSVFHFALMSLKKAWIHMFFFQLWVNITYWDISCQNFGDEAWWFLSLRVFGLLSSSLSLFPQRFGRYVLRPSLGVFRTWEPSRNFIVSTEVACSDSVSHNQVQVLSIPVLLLDCSQDWTCNLQMIVSLQT